MDEDSSSLENENWLSESLISSTLALNMPLLLFFLQTGLKHDTYLNINRYLINVYATMANASAMQTSRLLGS
jgi:hypothetical protein